MARLFNVIIFKGRKAIKTSVHSMIGENCMTIDDGQQIYDVIYPELAAGHPVELDFDRVEIFASPFFNAAIGQLLKDIEPDDLNRLLLISSLNLNGQNTMRRAIEHSKRYYSEEGMRKIIDDIFLEQSLDDQQWQQTSRDYGEFARQGMAG